MNEILFELVNMLKEIAPETWAILVRQSYVDGLFFVIISGLFCVLSFIGYKKPSDDTDKLIFSLGFSFVGLVLGAYGITYFLNPEFYALQHILEIIK